MADNTLRTRLDNDYWHMFQELCQHHDRDTPGMVRKLIRDGYRSVADSGSVAEFKASPAKPESGEKQ